MSLFVWSDESFWRSWQKKQKGEKVFFYVRIFLNFLDISVVNSKITYDKMDSTVCMSAMDFSFTLAHSMKGKFSNRKRAAQTINLQRNLKARVSTLLVICLSFPLPVLVELSVRANKLRIVHLFAVCPAMSHCVSRMKETVFYLHHYKW